LQILKMNVAEEQPNDIKYDTQESKSTRKRKAAKITAKVKHVPVTRSRKRHASKEPAFQNN
jgi:hypothetical protein